MDILKLIEIASKLNVPGLVLQGVEFVAAVITMQPGAGMAVATGVGLGFSGMLAVQFFGDRVGLILNAIAGGEKE